MRKIVSRPMDVGRDQLKRPSAAAHPDSTSPSSSNRLRDRPQWDDLLRSMLPLSQSSPKTVPNCVQPPAEQSSPARGRSAAADSARRPKPPQGRSHSRKLLAVLLPGDAELFAGSHRRHSQHTVESPHVASLRGCTPSESVHVVCSDYIRAI